MRAVIFFLVFLSPLPMASVRPVFQWFWIAYIAIAALAYLMLGKNKRPFSVNPDALSNVPSISLAFFAVFLIGGIVQLFLWFQIPPVASTAGLPVIWQPTAQVEKTLSLFVAHLLLFLLILFSDQEVRRSSIIDMVSLACCGYAAYGLCVYFSGNERILWFDKVVYLESLTSTFVNRNVFAAYVGLGLLCVTASATRWLILKGALENGFRNIGLMNELLSGRGWMYLIAAFSLFTTLVLTGSRAGIVSSLIGLLTFVLLMHVKLSLRTKNLMLALVFALLVAAVALQLSGDLLLDRILNGEGEQRWSIFAVTLDIIKNYPVTGTGLGTFAEFFAVFRTDQINSHFVRGHNDYLELLMTAGIPMASLLFLSIALAIRKLLSVYRSDNNLSAVYSSLALAAVIQISLHSAIDFPLQVPAVSFVFVILLAIGLSRRPEERPPLYTGTSEQEAKLS